MLTRYLWRRASAVLSICAFAGALNAAVFPAATMTAAVTFTDALTTTPIMLDWDGTNYWSCTGGNTSGVREARYSAAGAVLNTYSPGLDFRSIFSDASGSVYARAYNNWTIYKQAAPGAFTPFVTLASQGTEDLYHEPAQVGIVLNGTGTGYVGHDYDTIYQWNLAGGAVGPITLTGYGSLNGESGYPQKHRVASWGSYYLTYSNGVLSAWDASGNRVEQTTLTGAGTTDYSYWSISYANGYAWVIDDAGGLWRGYQIGTPGTPATPPPTVPVLSPLALALLGAMLLGFAAWMLRTRSLARN